MFEYPIRCRKTVVCLLATFLMILCLISSAYSSQKKAASLDKWTLWNGETRLRGANIHQRQVYVELDGPEYMGPGPMGPPYTQKDFNRLAALGANYVNISHPGLYTEKPPFGLNKAARDNLDRLLGMIAEANLFAVISFRTGPGRSEFTFVLDNVGDWYDESYLNDTVWTDLKARAAWASMWQYTAARYKDNPVVAGYDLMVEPNAGEAMLNDKLEDSSDPEEFYSKYAGTTYDWNGFYPKLAAAIRRVDKKNADHRGGNGLQRCRLAALPQTDRGQTDRVRGASIQPIQIHPCGTRRSLLPVPRPMRHRLGRPVRRLL